jgi:hypothetical protein
MKRLLLLILITYSTSPFSQDLYSKRPEMRVVNSVKLKAEILGFEMFNSVIIKTPASTEIKELVKVSEIREKNIGIAGNGKYFIIRAIVYGIKEGSNKEVLSHLFKGRVLDMECHSVILETYSGRLPACQIIIDDQDAILTYSQDSNYKNDILITTRTISPEIPLHTKYEKVISKLIIRDF